MAETNTLNVQGSFSGALSSDGPVFIGNGNSIGDDARVPALVTGLDTHAASNAAYSIVGGKFASAPTSCAFVFNGSEYPDGDSNSVAPPFSDSNPYTGAGTPGTFSINAVGGMGGVFIGGKSLGTHMSEITGNISTVLTTPSSDNNILHKSGVERVTGQKTVTSSMIFGQTANNRLAIFNSTISLSSGGGGGLEFSHANGGGSVTSTIKEMNAGELTVNASLRTTKPSVFQSASNTFNGITLSANAVLNAKNGKLYVSTASEGDQSSLAASTEFVQNAVQRQLASLSLDRPMSFSGVTTFTNSVYVGDRSMGDSSSLAANLKFVSGCISSLCNNKSNIGNDSVPIYLSNGKMTATTANQGNSGRPVYLLGGSITPITVSTGNANAPIYMSNGTVTACNPMVTTANVAQTVAGSKTFSGNTVFSGNASVGWLKQISASLQTHGNWCKGRDYALIRTQTPAGTTESQDNLRTAISLKTLHGSWDISTRYGSLNFAYITDDQYRSESKDLRSFILSPDGDTSKTKLGNTSVGKATQPVYVDGNGHIVPMNGAAGSTTRPVYLTGGSIVPISGTVGSHSYPVYMEDGYIRQCSSIVNLNNNQTIGGAKTFQNALTLCGQINFVRNAMVKGETPGSDVYWGIYFNSSARPNVSGSASLRMAAIENVVSVAGGYSQIALRTYANRIGTQNSYLCAVYDTTNNIAYATAPTPPDSTSTSENRIVTTGWANKYLSRNKDAIIKGASIQGRFCVDTGVATFNTRVEHYDVLRMYNSQRIRFYATGVADGDDTPFIHSDRVGHIYMSANGVKNSQGDTAASIQLGTASVGDANTPVYVNGGHLTPCQTEPSVLGTWSYDASLRSSYIEIPLALLNMVNTQTITSASISVGYNCIVNPDATESDRKFEVTSYYKTGPSLGNVAYKTYTYTISYAKCGHIMVYCPPYGYNNYNDDALSASIRIKVPTAKKTRFDVIVSLLKWA